MSRRTPTARALSPYALAGLLTVAGLSHFRWPRAYAAIVPRQVPHRYAVAKASGVGELVCAAGIAMPRTRRLAAWTTAVLFVAVFPANVQMAWDARRRSTALRVGTLLRLPVQAPLVWWAVSVAKSAVRTTPRRSGD